MPVESALELDVLAPPHQNVKLRSSLHPESKYYELRYESELSMEDIARLATLTEQAEPVIKNDTLDPATGKLLDEWLDEAIGIMFHTPLEDTVLAEMGYWPKWKIIEFFGQTCINLSGTLQEAAAKAKKPPTPKATKHPTGEA